MLRCILSRKNNIESPSADKLFAIGIESICDKVAGAELYKDIAADCGVGTSTLMRWLSLEDHEAAYARAVVARAERLVEETIEISDMDPGTTPQGGTDSGAVAHQRLRVDSRKWLVSKMLPKKYGDSSTLEIGNKDGKPFKTTQDLSKLSEAELKSLMAIRKKIDNDETD